MEWFSKEMVGVLLCSVCVGGGVLDEGNAGNCG